MDVFVIIATKGRPCAVKTLLGMLRGQKLRPLRVYVIGAGLSDVSGIAGEVPRVTDDVTALVSNRPGLCVQRNVGIERVLADREAAGADRPFFVAFLDDDFRPASDWLLQCRRVFQENPQVVGVTGRVLADGVNNAGLTEAEALAHLSGHRLPMKHWASGESPREIDSAYGCNMAFRDVVLTECLFDENLPLYGWQEDQDFTSRARKFGKVMYRPECRGVHLGTKSGRISGRRFGYSQIANPWYLSRKGTMSPKKSLRFVSRHLASNVVRSLTNHPQVDYPGRLRGNLVAIADLLRGRCHPARISRL